MENKDQNTAQFMSGALEGADVPNSGVRQAPLDTNALSLEPTATPFISQEQQPKGEANVFLRFTRRLDVMLAALLLIAGAVVIFSVTRGKSTTESPNTSATATYGTVAIPLDDIISGKDLTPSGAANVTINGPIQLNNGLYVAPTLQPTGARAGQIYYDQGTNQLAYFNGEQFVFLTSPAVTPGGLQSLGGATGALTLGSGLNLSNNQLSNGGVLSVQGQTGDVTFTAGPGIVINGTSFSNNGVLSVAAGSPNVVVTNDGAGNVTIDVAALAGSGTVTSSGGTSGRVPLFTAAQNIENSIITQSGLTVTITGDLSVVTGGLTLSNALSVSNGGTGANSFANNGVLVGNGTAAVSAVAAPGTGLCLISTAGAPTWAACPGGSGVTTLNGLNGAVNIANASAAGSTVTLDDASTSSKGIASFNGTNFSVSSGNVNTIQNINTGATPTFAGVNTNTITPSAALTVGISAQTALLQGSTTTITSNGVGNTIVLNSAATIELQDNTNITGNLATSGDVAVNGGDITSSGAFNITPGGALTVGASSQTLTLQGGAASSFRASSGANTTVVGFTSPTANTTLNFPALAAGTYTICTTSGNCSGSGATLQSAYDNSSDPEIVLDATRGALTIRDNSTPLGANLLEVQNNAGSATYLAVTSAGVAVTGIATVSGNINSSTGALQTNGISRIDNSGNAVNLGNITLSGAISGGTTITGSGNINTSGGALQTNGTSRIDNSGNLINIAAVTASGNATFQGGGVTIGTSSQAGTLTLNDGSSNAGVLQVAALGQDTTFILPDPGAGTATICLTTGNCAGSGGGVTTGGGTTNRVAKFTGSQALGDSSISDDGTNVSVSVDVIVQGGDLTVGTTSQAASMILHDGNGQTTTLQAGNSSGNLTFVLPTNTGSANQCLKQSGTGNQLVWQDCDGGSGGSSATLQTAYNNSTTPEITLNSSVGGLTIRDNSTPLGSNLFEIQNNAGSTTYLAVTVSGVSVTGAASATGNINTSGGALQTNSTTRIDNSGNVVNIGNITGSGPITIASIGAGNDITIDGADEFIVQDGATFNALTTFNANIDLGANDIVGTTSDINLTNFDVIGASGNVTAGTYNGQTISSSANFTGTVAVASDASIGGDVAVNGGDITSSGALNITPGGTLTVGVTGQQLILQGNASTRLTATGGGFTTAVGFTGSPTGAVTYNFDRAAAAGTYTICTTIGNCTGTGGSVTTSGGTTGTLAKFTGAQTLGDSLLSESGSTVTVNGNLNLVSANQFQVNGTQISSANLSNDANLAKLSGSQTFTGNTVAFQNGANSANAFNVQNQTGGRILTVNTTGAQVVLGTASTLDGSLVFQNMSNANTVTILPGTPTGNRTLTLPDASGVICTDSGNCSGAGATLQTAYNFSVGGTTPKIKVNSTLGAVDVQDADSTLSANLFNVRASNAGGLGTVMFGIHSTGAVTLQNSSNSTTAFRLLTQGGTSVLTGDTQNGAIILGQSGTLTGSLVFNNASNANTTAIAITTPTSSRTITLPDATGTVCLSSGNCSGSGSSNTLQAAYDAGNTILTSNARDINFQLADTAADPNFLVDLQCDTSCSTNGRFAIQDDGIDVFTISPAGGSVTTTGNVTLGDDASTDTLTINAVLQGSSPLILEGGTADANELTISIASLTTDRTITLPDETGTVCLQGSSSCGFLTGTAANYIQNQNAGQQASSNFWISATGRADVSLLAPTFDTPTAVALAIGGTATAINLNENTTVTGSFTHTGSSFSSSTTSSASLTSNGSITITADGTSTWSTTSGNLNVQAAGVNTLNLLTAGAGTVALGNQNTTTINIGRGSNMARTINIGDAGTSTAQTITIGSTGSTSTTTVQGGTGATALNFTTGTNGSINLTTAGTGDINMTSTDAIVAKAATSFQIQNTSNADYVNINMANSTIDLFGYTASSGHLPSLTATSSLNAARWGMGAVALNGYMYTFGGSSGVGGSCVATTTSQYAKINADGTLGTWATTTVLPGSSCDTTAVTYNGYIYVHGQGSTNIYMAKPDVVTGVISSWTTLATAANSAISTNFVAYNGYIYETNMNSPTVNYAKINADGTLAAFSSMSNWYSGDSRRSAGVGVANGYFYSVAGGALSTGDAKTYYGKVNANGSLSASATLNANNLPVNRQYLDIAIANGYIYAIGGHDGTNSQTSIYYAPLGASGAVGTWTADTTVLPTAINSLAVVTYNGYIYTIGGDTGSAPVSNVYYTSTPRVKVAGNLDLTSYGGENNTEGGAAGTLTAGNTNLVGTLNVAENATFRSGVSIQGNLNVAGELNVGSFSGAGLVDCDGATSKLLYDSTTKQFSCGTDKPSVMIQKTLTETVTSSAALQNDDDFTFTVGANETWIFQINALYTSNATADIIMALNVPSGTTNCRISATDTYVTSEDTSTTCTDAGDLRLDQSDSGGDAHPLFVYGAFTTGGTGGTVNFRWAQNSANLSTSILSQSFLLAYKATGADLAEAYYTNDASITPGDIVRVDGSLQAGVGKTEGAYDSGAIGVVSTQPGFILSDPNAAHTTAKPVLLALSGRIPVKVSLENGPIRAGDYLTTSSIPGVAMKATKPGQMIGKALEGYDSNNPSAIGKVMTFANLTYADPNSNVSANNSLQNGTFGNLNVSGVLTAKDLTVTGKASINDLVVGTMATSGLAVTGSMSVAEDINLQGVGKSRNAITKKFIASKHIPIGSVVIIDPINDGQVTTTTVVGDKRVLGVALTEAQAGKEVTVAIGGSVQVKAATSALIQGGDLLVSSSQEGAAEGSSNPATGAMIGKALGKTENGDLVWVIISLH